MNFITEESEKYHEKSRSGRYLSSHMLAHFRRSPLFYHRHITGQIEDVDRPAYLIGRATHALILEGREEFDARYLVADGPINPKTGKAYGATTKKYAEWLTTQNREILTPAQGMLVEQMASSIETSPGLDELVNHLNATAEGVIRIEKYSLPLPIPCQIRFDLFIDEDDGILVDLKTCDDLTWFESDARRYQYFHQLAFYRQIIMQSTGKTPHVVLVGVEKKQPFRAGVFRIDPALLEECRIENEEAIEYLMKCREDDIWPSGYEEIRTIE